MKGMKYIAFEDWDGNESFVIFSPWLKHNHVAEKLTDVKKVTSAGWVTIHDGEIFAHGDSITLKIGPKPMDTKLLRHFLKGEPHRQSA